MTNVTLISRIIRQTAKEKYEFKPLWIHTAVWCPFCRNVLQKYGIKDFWAVLKVKSGSFIIKAKSTANGKLAAEPKLESVNVANGNVHIL
jgi:hypothetical protein